MSTDDLRHLLDRAAEPPGGPLQPPTADIIARARTHRRWTRLGTAGACVLAIALAAGVPYALHGRPQRPVHGRIPGGSAQQLAAGQFQYVPDPPNKPRTGAAMVWTGSEVVTWGGMTSNLRRDDGASYDPATARWTTIPSAPLTARVNATALWTGQEVLIYGGDSGARYETDGAFYNPATRTWRPIPASGATGSDVTVESAVIVAGRAVFSRSARPYRTLLYDLARNTWTQAAAIPNDPEDNSVTHDLVAAGEDLYLIERHTPGQGVTFLRYDWAAGVWRRLASVANLVIDQRPVWDGQEILLASEPVTLPCRGACPTGPGGTFPIGTFPVGGVRARVVNSPVVLGAPGSGLVFGGATLWTGRALVAAHYAWDAENRRWLVLPKLPVPGSDPGAYQQRIWAGSGIFVVFGDAGGPGYLWLGS